MWRTVMGGMTQTGDESRMGAILWNVNVCSSNQYSQCRTSMLVVAMLLRLLFMLVQMHTFVMNAQMMLFLFVCLQ